MRQTKIIATLGPATTDPSVLRALFDAGLDLVRLNFSYGTHDDHEQVLRAVRQVETDTGRKVGVLQDLPGPKLRTGRLPGGGLELRRGDTVRLSTNTRASAAAPPSGGTDLTVPVHYPALAQDVRAGDRVFLQDGEIGLRVTSVGQGEVVATALNGGRLRQHAGINLPGVQLSVPAVTDEDLRHLDFGVAHRVDFVALSFVESADEIVRVREHLARRAARPALVAKIERRRAVERIEEIIAAADAVMVARGDLAVELAPEDVPVLQKRIITACNRRGRPVIIATQMLESMVERPRPTRAEAADVANAVFDGADALMLSGETAIGRFPVETVATMARIAQRAEEAGLHVLGLEHRPEHGTAEAIAFAAVQAAETLGAAAIVAATGSGSTALRVARFRPRRPIVAVTPHEATLRRLRLVWGVHPVVIQHFDDLDALIADSAQATLRTGIAHRGETVVVTAGYPLGQPGTTNFLKVVRLEN